jgi:hypothetical protein
MSKKAKTLLILSCIFVTIAFLVTAFDMYLSGWLFSIFFTHPENLGAALGLVFGIIIFIAYTLIFGVIVLVTGGLTLGFVIPLIKLEGKKWYSILILVVAIVAMALVVFTFAMIPVISDASNAANSSSSSSSDAISSSIALMLL